MKKYIFNITAGAALLFMAGGCTDKFEEYNTNEYQIHEADPATLMKSMIETIVNIQQNDSQMQDQMVGQFGGYLCPSNTWSGTNFGTYNMSDAWNASPWNTPYEKIYGNFFQIQEATNSQGHYYAFASMIRAITMLRVADCYGPIPYSEVQKGNFYVAYDTQEQVYEHIIADLANAADVLYNYHKETSGNKPLGANDPVFNGDYSKWVKLANSMRLRVAMRMSDFLPNARQYAEAATAHEGGLIESNSDNAMLSCGTQTNPYQLAAVSWGDLRANANIVDYMNAYNDPRAAAYFNKSTIKGMEGKYVGMRTGDADFTKADAGAFSTPNVSGSDAMMVFCAAETAFLRAEGKLRQWNVGSKSAKEYYESGINLSMMQYNVPGSEYMEIDEAPLVTHASDDIQKAAASISNTVSVKWDDAEALTVTGKNFQRIITQKWIANYPLGLEAWAEYRRTGYPVMYPCIDNLSNGVVSTQRGMRRLAFPYTERNNNKANCEAGMVDLGGADTPATDLKWAKKN